MERVLLITDYLDTITGGAEKQIYLLASGLVRRGWGIEILVLQSECRDRDLFEREGINVVEANIRRVYSWHGQRWAYEWRKKISDRGYSVIFTYHFGSDLWTSLYLRRYFSGPIISMRRDNGFWMRYYHPLVYRYIIHPRVDLVCAVSNQVKEKIIAQEGVKEDRVRVIYNGVELDKFPFSPKQEGQEFSLLYVANLSQVKNHITLLSALCRLKGKIKRFRLFLIGKDKGEEKRLKKFVYDHGLSKNVEFLGEQRNIPDWISKADVCLQASLSEGMSNTLLEYMAGGRPIIASDIPSNREVLADAGVVVNPLDPDEIAGAILTLYSSPEIRRELGLKARKRAEERFSVERMLDEYETLLREVIGCEM